LSEFDFEIKHLKGKENYLPDALSRIFHDVYEISYGQVKFYFFEKNLYWMNSTEFPILHIRDIKIYFMKLKKILLSWHEEICCKIIRKILRVSKGQGRI